jgi:hypothetical protein
LSQQYALLIVKNGIFRPSSDLDIVPGYIMSPERWLLRSRLPQGSTLSLHTHVNISWGMLVDMIGVQINWKGTEATDRCLN